MKTQRLFGILVLGLGLTLALLAGLHTAQATPAATDFFVKPNGSGDCSQSDPCALQTALDKATKDDSVLYVAGGVYTGTGAAVITLTRSITLYGGWDGVPFGPPIVRNPAVHKSILDGEGARRVVHISGSIAPTLDGLTIANGNATGLNLADCSGAEGSPDGCGGGIFVRNAHPIIVNNVITNNIAAVTTAGSPAGTTGYGGGIYLRSAPQAVISGNLVISNAASTAHSGTGGGIYLSRYGTMSGAQVQSNRVLSNTATTTDDSAWGGGISGGPDGVVIQDNSVIGNRANGSGGGQGAGLYQWYGSATYLNNLVTGNLGSVSGQAAYLGYSGSNFESNRVVDNATSQGIKLPGTSGDGPTLVNNVVARSGDTTVLLRGAMNYPLTATLIHNTLVGSGSGTGVYVETGYVTLFMTNTIIAGHMWGVTNTTPASSTILADHTLFWANTHDGIRGINPVDGNLTFAADGYHIGSGCSAAIDAGISAGVTTDIDGEARPYGPGYDIGADELSTGLACWRVYLPIVLRN